MIDSEYPWRDESLLYELYWDQELSTVKIADKLGCTQQTVSKWMQKFDIPRRDSREAAPNQRRHPAVFTDRGYVICASNYRGATDSVGIHRLVMVAERGFDAVADKHVHHKMVSDGTTDRRISNSSVAPNTPNDTVSDPRLSPPTTSGTCRIASATHGADSNYDVIRRPTSTRKARRPEDRELTPDRSLDLANHSPSGFKVGYSGSGPAQLTCALLLDYYDDAQVAREHYIAFRNQVVSQLEYDGAAACWHLPGEETDAAMATITDVIALPDGGRPSPTLPENWRTVSRPDRRVFQRADRDHYIVLGDGSDECLVVLCSQGDRAYPAPLAHRTVAEEADVERVIRELAEESNDLIEPPEGEH